MLNSIFAILLSSCIFLGNVDNNTLPLTLKFTRITSSKGHIIVTVYKTAQDFEDENPYMTRTFSKQKLQNGVLEATLQLPKGTYGIAALDDENKDKEMNYTLLGMPTEGFGFANYYHTGFSYPKFEDFKFNHTSSNRTHVVKLRYISF